MKRTLFAGAVTLSLMLAPLGSVAAAPPESNPNVVAYYEEGDHGIVGENTRHWGEDVVMATGQNGNFQQWFYGDSEGEEGVHGEHSVWKVSEDGTCADNWDHVHEPYPEWGDYLTPGVDYCVKTNDFRP